MERKQKAVDILPKFLDMIESDLLKATHYLKEAIKVAIVAEDTELSEKLAEHYVAADELTKEYQKLTRKIVD